MCVLDRVIIPYYNSAVKGRFFLCPVKDPEVIKHEKENRSHYGEPAQVRKYLCDGGRVCRRGGSGGAYGGALRRGDVKLEGCRCLRDLLKTGKACSFDDDFNKIAPAIEEADGIVFAMPVYWYSVPAQIKCVIDKLYSFCVAGRDVAGKECG